MADSRMAASFLFSIPFHFSTAFGIESFIISGGWLSKNFCSTGSIDGSFSFKTIMISFKTL